MFEEAKIKLLKYSKLDQEVTSKFATTPCRIWQRGKDKDGYGLVTIYGKETKSHVLMCEIKNQKHKPEGMVTRHLCGNKLCCAEDHVDFGTYSENGIDAVIQGMIKCSLNEDQVREVREECKTTSMASLARKYNVSKSIIKDVVSGKRYTHIK